jgi:hypothetical protein
MSDQSIYDFLNTPGNMSAMNYGLELDPSGKTDPYKQLGWQTDAIKALGSIGGLYPEDLLGLPEAPQMPDYTPYQSDFLSVMGNNPVIKATAEGIAQGVPPMKAAQAAKEAAKAQGYDISGMDDNWIQEQAVQFATESARQNREQSQYASDVANYQGYDQPTRIQDAPTTEDLIKQYAGGLKFGATQDPQWGDKTLGGKISSSSGYKGAPARSSTGPVSAGQGGLGSLIERRTGVQANSLAQPKMGAVDRKAKDMIEKAARGASERMSYGPSQREMANRARVALMWQMAAGMPAPR